jgi:hypothetical protein
LLQNPQQTRLYAVTIATELAVEKTVEMLESLQKLGIDQPTNSGEPMPILPSSGSERDISAKSRAGLVCRIAANQGFSANRTRGYRDADGFR